MGTRMTKDSGRYWYCKYQQVMCCECGKPSSWWYEDILGVQSLEIRVYCDTCEKTSRAFMDKYKEMVFSYKPESSEKVYSEAHSEFSST